MFVSKPYSGRVFIAQRSPRGYHKLVWSVLILASTRNDIRIEASKVPKRIRRAAYRLFERDTRDGNGGKERNEAGFTFRSKRARTYRKKPCPGSVTGPGQIAG